VILDLFQTVFGMFEKMTTIWTAQTISYFWNRKFFEPCICFGRFILSVNEQKKYPKQYLNAIVLSASEKVFLKIRFGATSCQVSALNSQRLEIL